MRRLDSSETLDLALSKLIPEYVGGKRNILAEFHENPRCDLKHQSARKIVI